MNIPDLSLPRAWRPFFASLGAGAGLLAVLATGGCFVVFSPGEVVETPSVSGTLRADGKALPAVELRLASVHGRGDCQEAAVVTRTAADGTFAFEPTRARRSFEVVPLAPSTPAYTVQVCVDRGAGAESLYRQTFTGSLPLHLSLDCDLGRPARDQQACEAVLAGRQTPGYRGID